MRLIFARPHYHHWDTEQDEYVVALVGRRRVEVALGAATAAAAAVVVSLPPGA